MWCVRTNFEFVPTQPGWLAAAEWLHIKAEKKATGASLVAFLGRMAAFRPPPRQLVWLSRMAERLSSKGSTT